MEESGNPPKLAAQVANALLKQYLHEQGLEETYKMFRSELARKKVPTQIASEKQLAEELQFDRKTSLTAQLVASSAAGEVLRQEDPDDKDNDETNH